MMDLSVVPYESKPAVGCDGGGGGGARYRECLRNHAAALGGQAFDGCGEFMPSAGADGLKCAACGCHRNFHRRDAAAGGGGPLLLPPAPFQAYFPLSFSRPAPVPARLGSETPPRREEGGGAGGEGSRKRFRTKFTADQKEKMQAFAERIGWRIQRHDDVALQEFCVEVGVKRHVLKVWMHNNKSHLSSSSAAAGSGGVGKSDPPAAAPGGAPISV